MCNGQRRPCLSEGLHTWFVSLVILTRHQLKVLATAGWDPALSTQLRLNESSCL